MSWGPPTWFFLHALCEKIHPDHYLLVKDSLWNHIKELCSLLPCPDCSSHATSHLSKLSTPPSKDHLVQVMYHFHNEVNLRTNKPIFPIERMTQYKTIPLLLLFTMYKKTLHQPYNPKLMMHKMRGRQFVQRFQVWLQQQRLL
jgi:hypothetical protein